MRAVSVGPVLSVCLGIALIVASRGHVSRVAQKQKERTDAYALPPTDALVRLSFGYRSALADYLWAHVLVTQGLRMYDKRPFEHLHLYMDAITTLDPPFRDPYRFADSLFAFQINDPNREENVRRGRYFQERGLSHRPFDSELWLSYGQFLAYTGSGVLENEEERTRWRMDGAKALVRAAELGTASENSMWKTVSAATILSKAGENDAALRFLERAYSMTEDEDLRNGIANRIAAITHGDRQLRGISLSKSLDNLWRAELPFVPRVLFSALGPSVRTWECAGSAPNATLCERTWTAWAKAAQQD